MSEKLKPGMAKKLIDYIFSETCPFCGEHAIVPLRYNRKTKVDSGYCECCGASFRVDKVFKLLKIWITEFPEKLQMMLEGIAVVVK